jgi:hypothetical protein
LEETGKHGKTRSEVKRLEDNRVRWKCFTNGTKGYTTTTTTTTTMFPFYSFPLQFNLNILITHLLECGNVMQLKYTIRAHSVTSTVEFKNTWRCTYTSPVCPHGSFFILSFLEQLFYILKWLQCQHIQGVQIMTLRTFL